MTATAEATATVGDYDLRGPDYETELVGALTGRIGDADRFVRDGRYGEPGWSNGFPNFAMYRTAYAGDTHLATDLRLWCEAFGVAYCHSGGMRRPDPNLRDAVGVCAGRDAYIALVTQQWGASAFVVARTLGVDDEMYQRVRRELLARLKTSLNEYWMRLGIAMRQVVLAERRQVAASLPSVMRDGRGFGDESEGSMMLGDGNLRAMQKYIE